MGSSLSKVNRRLPKTLEKSIKPSPTTPSRIADPKGKEKGRVLAQGFKDHFIDADGKDPQFMANLRQLGQINVKDVKDVKASTIARNTEERVLQTFEARKVSEQQAASPRPVPNYLSATSLANLLEDRKFMNSKAEVGKLAARYSLDYSLLESLARFVTTPSIGEGTVLRTKNSTTGEEKMTMRAVWTEPVFRD